MFTTNLTKLDRIAGIRFLLPILLLAACGSHHADVPTPMPPDQQLALKYDRYVALSAATQGPHGWVVEDSCDALLFASLTAAATGVAIDIESARGADGEWYRNPSQTCFPDRSSSTISRDMFLGLFWYVHKFARSDLAQQVFSYGDDHHWVMGKGDLSRTFMTPNEQADLALLTGDDHVIGHFEPVLSDSATGFEAHLVAVDLALRVRLGKATDDGQGHAQHLVDRQPHNPLFQAVLGLYTGNQLPAVMLLLSPTYWPDDRLPTSADRCEPWLTQRDEGIDWQPCPERGLTHSGGDFLYAAALALGKL